MDEERLRDLFWMNRPGDASPVLIGRAESWEKGPSLVCIDPMEARALWRVELGRERRKPCVIGTRSLVLFGGEGQLEALEPESGASRWKVPVEGLEPNIEARTLREQLVEAEGSIFIDTTSGRRRRLTCIATDTGSVRWSERMDVADYRKAFEAAGPNLLTHVDDKIRLWGPSSSTPIHESEARRVWTRRGMIYTLRAKRLGSLESSRDAIDVQAYRERDLQLLRTGASYSSASSVVAGAIVKGELFVGLPRQAGKGFQLELFRFPDGTESRVLNVASGPPWGSGFMFHADKGLPCDLYAAGSMLIVNATVNRDPVVVGVDPGSMSERWRAPFEEWPRLNLSLDDDTVLVSGRDAVALDPETGEVRWSRNLSDPELRGGMVFGHEDGALRVVSAISGETIYPRAEGSLAPTSVLRAPGGSAPGGSATDGPRGYRDAEPAQAPRASPPAEELPPEGPSRTTQALAAKANLIAFALTAATVVAIGCGVIAFVVLRWLIAR